MVRRPADKPFSSGVAGGRSLIRRERFRRQTTVRIKGLEEIIDYMDGFGDALLAQTGKAVVRASIIVQREIMRNITRRFTQRTGKFRKSWDIRVITKGKAGAGQLAGGAVTGIIGSDHPGAAIQDVGGTIYAKGVPMPVPVTEEARRKRASGFDRSLNKTTSGLLVEGIGAEAVVQFVLSRTVSIQGTNYLHEAVQIAEPKVVDEIGEKGVGIAVKLDGKRRAGR